MLLANNDHTTTFVIIYLQILLLLHYVL